MKFTVAHKENISKALKGKETWLSRLKRTDYAQFLEHQSKVGKLGAEVNRKNKTGCYFSKELQSKAGKIAQRKYDYSNIWKDTIKAWRERDPEGYIRHQKYASNKALEFYPELHCLFGSRYGSIGGKTSALNPDNIKRATEVLATYRETADGRLLGIRNIERFRRNKRHYFKGIYFSSIGEFEVAKQILEYGLEKQLIKGRNTHIIIPTGKHYREFDFFIQNILFVEYHPYDLAGLTVENYYQKRRKILDENNLLEKQLVILTSTGEFEEKVLVHFR